MAAGTTVKSARHQRLAETISQFFKRTDGICQTTVNLVETLFSKMARTFLKYIRVNSKDELHERILNGIAEINESPVVHRWKNFDFAIAK